jgi:hypothetical protein
MGQAFANSSQLRAGVVKLRAGRQPADYVQVVPLAVHERRIDKFGQPYGRTLLNQRVRKRESGTGDADDGVGAVAKGN